MKDSLEARQRWTGAGSGSDSSSNSDNGSGSGSIESSGTSSWPPLRFTCDLDHNQPACKDIRLTFTGGCKPYTLSAFWYTDGQRADPTWVELKEQTWDESFQWNIIAPVSSQLLFTITDARGSTITSEDAIFVQSNEMGMARDSWCQYVYNKAPIPTAATNGSHRYAWNASSGQDDDDGGSSSDSITSGTSTSSFASKITASNSVDGNATDMNDKSTTISKAIHDANQAKTIEGVLAALLGVSLIALFALVLLFRQARKRLREARSHLARHQGTYGYSGNGSDGRSAALHGVMSEKPGQVDQYSPNGGAVTPRAGRNGELRNPFDDPSAMAAGGGGRSPFLNVMGTPNSDRGRLSLTSLVSAVPSNGARSTAADSSMSTEFYHTYKASTIPPRGSNDTSPLSNAFGGRMRNLFGAPMSFFSSATPSPTPSRTTGGGDTSTLNTDYYGDRNRVTQQGRPATTRSEGSAGTIIIPITRVSTRSDFTSLSAAGAPSDAETSSSHLAPSSITGSRSRGGSSSSNAADESSIHSNDVYDDSDAASFSNFSYIDTGAGGSDAGESTLGSNASSSREEATVLEERAKNPFRDQSPDERMNKRRSWNGSYGDLDRGYLDSTDSLASSK